MLAQVLADEGHEVDLVGHKDVGKEILADHLGLNLGKVNLRIVPERGSRRSPACRPSTSCSSTPPT